MLRKKKEADDLAELKRIETENMAADKKDQLIVKVDNILKDIDTATVIKDAIDATPAGFGFGEPTKKEPSPLDDIDSDPFSSATFETPVTRYKFTVVVDTTDVAKTIETLRNVDGCVQVKIDIS